MFLCCFFFFKQKTAYEMRISDWSSDVCSSDLDRSTRTEQPLRPARCRARASRADGRIDDVDDPHAGQPADRPAEQEIPNQMGAPAQLVRALSPRARGIGVHSVS